MCGIFGYAGLDQPQLLARMARLLAHRGPDDEGIRFGPGWGLGNRRLSIIDLAGGRQPIPNEDESCWVVCNGEIYNYRELRQELLRAGHHLRTASDTEVIVHLYEELGDDFVRRLRGMFAVALWDARRRRLLLARDRLGEKPLYYAQADGGLLFASELKGVLASPSVGRDINRVALTAYLSYLYIPAPLTIFEQTHALPAGHTLTFQDNNVSTKPYWDVTFRHETSDTRDGDEHVHRCEDELEDAVRATLVSDVPVGVFLSGGLDSSAILALATRHAPRLIHTFCVGYGQDARGYNELDAARAAASHFATEHHELILDHSIVEHLPRIVWQFDQPFANPTSLLVDQLASFTRQVVKVVLAGTGGDETLLGYPRYAGEALCELVERLPISHLISGLSTLTSPLPEPTAGSTAWARLAKRLKRLLTGLEMPFAERYLSWSSHLNGPELLGLYPEARSDGFLEGAYDLLRRHMPQEDRPTPADLDCASYVDIKTYLPGNQLEYVDKMTMAHGLEARAPFCDYRFVEFAASLPVSARRRHITQGKWVLRRLAQRLLPQELLRRGKIGFDAPVGHWFKGPLHSLYSRLVKSGALTCGGLLSNEAIESLWRQHTSGRRDLSYQLWSILVLAVWFHLYVEHNSLEPPEMALGDLLSDTSFSARKVPGQTR